MADKKGNENRWMNWCVGTGWSTWWNAWNASGEGASKGVVWVLTGRRWEVRSEVGDAMRMEYGQKDTQN